LRELVPQATVFGFLLDPNDAVAETQLKDVQVAAQAMGRQLIMLNATTEEDIEAAFVILSTRPSALLIGSNPFLYQRLHHIVALAARYGVPTCYFERELRLLVVL
jgi:putative tryptophan/tyrosine transport system substrate-binding protein